MSAFLSSSLPFCLVFFCSSFLLGQSLTVAAASDLSKVTPELAAAFAKTNPNIQVHFVSGASSLLAQQIEAGAPYDVFLSANSELVDQLASKRKLKPQTYAYAIGRLALVWRDGKAHKMSDLTQNWVRFLAVANPKLAPYGVAAQQALQHERLWEKIESKIVYGENVRQALQLFDSGNADAVFTAGGLASGRAHQLIPREWHGPIVQKAGVVADSPKQNDAALFVRFLLGPTAQGIFARRGFDRLR